jgi:hypothetical protein
LREEKPNEEERKPEKRLTPEKKSATRPSVKN